MPPLNTIPLNLGKTYFRGRTALVTGASSGIGRDVALNFARMGARVGLVARRTEELNRVAAEISREGGSAVVLTADVTRREQIREAVKLALDQFGHIDILVNSAGILNAASVEAVAPADLEQMIAVNLFGTLHAIQAVVPAMRSARSGRIVNIASLAGRRGIPSLGGYSASKFAVVGLTEALRVELCGSGVRVSLILPGVVNTPMSESGGGDQPSAGMPAGIWRMPVRWVTWAVVAAVVLGLPEVAVPPGAGVAGKIAALFPSATDLAIAMGDRALRRFCR